MTCKTCGTEFKGDFCPACATPIKKEEKQTVFYKNPWFWVSFVLFICLLVGAIKENMPDDAIDSSAPVSQNKVDDFFVSSTKQSSSDIVSDEGVSSSSSKASIIETPSSSKTELTNSTTVYITPSGKRYHISQKCAGKNSTATNVEKAKGEGKTPCQRCLKQSKD